MRAPAIPSELNSRSAASSIRVRVSEDLSVVATEEFSGSELILTKQLN
jgi:hypothetical protein